MRLNRLFVLAAISSSLLPPAYAATANCWCHLTANQTRINLGPDLTSAAHYAPGGFDPQDNPANKKQCLQRCADVSAAADRQALANSVCPGGNFNGNTIRTTATLGARFLGTAYTWGQLKDTDAVTITGKKCPPDWQANGNGDLLGGITPDGRCKKVAGPFPTPPNPAPPNGTQIGPPDNNWGFVWGGDIVVYGSQLNGGAPTTVVLSTAPASCGWQ